MSMNFSVVVLLLLGSKVGNGFASSKFKKCRDSAFCQRNRHVKRNGQYQLLPDSLHTTDTRIIGRLKNVETRHEFLFTLSSIKGGIVRMHVTEPAPIQRYEVENILVTDPPEIGSPWTVNQASETLTLVSDAGKAAVVVRPLPFSIVIKREGREVIEVNSNSFFHFEHTRSKEDGAEEGLWEETFNGFKDSKPKGPRAIALDVTYKDTQHVFGIPEHSTRLSLPITYDQEEAVSEPYRLYNLDVFEYELDSNFGLYGSIPFLIGQNQVDASGVFWLNAAEMYIDIWKDGKSTHSQWIAESGVLDVFFMTGATAKDILRQYTSLTGTTALPQYFAIGYHQCRWNYKDEADVKHVDAMFDRELLPYDVLWLDIEHTDHKKYMTWDPVAFPHPASMQEDLASRGRRMVVIIDPHIKTDDQYQIYTEAKKRGYYVKNKDSSDFEGQCWPGKSSYLDVTRTEVREWWATRLQPKNFAGMTKTLYVWNDMNEPSVFDGPEVTMQKDLLHSGSIEHRDVHNLVGFLFHMATAAGLEQRGVELYGIDGDRPFVLSRAYFAGSQRLGPIWTGDNMAEWDHLKASISMILTNSLAGMPFCGADLTGFFGNPDTELFTRWYQIGAFYPFMRGHAHIETKRREPWLFGEQTTNRIRKALRERYALLPYLYTEFYRSHISGEPILRPLWYEFLHEELMEVDEEFMFGPALLVRPILEAGVTQIDTYFPPSTCWYDAWTGQMIQTSVESPRRSVPVRMEEIPVYYRGGSIVVRKERPRRCTDAMKDDPVTLIVALDNDGKAIGEVYMDDGRSSAFLRHAYVHRRLIFSDNELTSINLNSLENSNIRFSDDISVEKIILLGLTSKLEVYEKVSLRRIEAAWGPLRLEQGAPTVGYTIKKPMISINSDWSLIFSPPKQ